MNKKGSFVKVFSVNPGQRMYVAFFEIVKRTDENVELKHKVDVKKKLEIKGACLDCADSLSEPPSVKIKESGNGKEEFRQAYFYEWDGHILIINAS